nr:IS200/IS605 family transposase [Peptoniphilus rhinitidis]
MYANYGHILLEIPPKLSILSFIGFLKGKSSIMIYEKWDSLKYKYNRRKFWCRGYYIDTEYRNTKAIKEYI